MGVREYSCCTMHRAAGCGRFLVHHTSRAFLAKLPLALPSLRRTRWRLAADWARAALATAAPPAFLFLLLDLGVGDEAPLRALAGPLPPPDVGLLICDMCRPQPSLA